MNCVYCDGEEALTHSTEQHSEDWVNLADARETGEVIFMPNTLIQDAIGLLLPSLWRDIPPIPQWEHVDRRVVQALAESLYDGDSYDLSLKLYELLNANPVRAIE